MLDAKKVVVKVIRRSDTIESDEFKEIKIGMCLQHENIVQYLGYFLGQSTKVCLVMEAMDDDLKSALVKGFVSSDAIRLSISTDLAAGMQHAHSKNVLHRDLKPENCLTYTDSDNILKAKIGDWGQARLASPLNIQTSAPGTLAYM